MAETLVPLPPGFQLTPTPGQPVMPQPSDTDAPPAPQQEATPPLPPGFVLQSASETTAPQEKPSVMLGNGDWGLGSEILNSMVFGTLPNIDAAVTGAAKSIPLVGNGKSLSENYDADLQAGQDARRQYREAHPLWATAGAVGGGLIGGAGLAKSGATLTGRIANEGLSNILPRTLAGAAEGAGYGAAQGFGGGEGGFDNRVQGAKDNMLLGAIFGAAAPAVVDTVKAGAGAVRNAYVGAKEPLKRADELLVKAIMRDKQTPGDLALDVTGAKMEGQPAYTAADAAGENTKKLLKRASRTPGEFRDTAVDTAIGRQTEQGNRIGTYLDDALGQKGDSAFKTEADLVASRRADASGLYDAAFANQLPDNEFYKDLATKPIVQQAIKNMDLAARNSIDGMKGKVNLDEMYLPVVEGQAGTKAADGTETRQLSARGWDYVKRYLDKHVDALYSSSNSDDKALAPVYKELRDTLRERLSQDNPAYGEALKKFSDDTAAIKSIQTGRDLANARNADEASAAFSKLDDGQKELARVGAGREFGVKLDNMQPGQDKTRVFDTPNAKGKVGVLAKDELADAIFNSRIGREKSMVRTNNTIRGGSDTAENLADTADMNPGGSALGALFAGHPLRAAGYAAGKAFGHVTNAAQGINEESAKRIGDYLLNTNPAEINSLADFFVEMQRKAAQPSMAPTIMTSGFNGPRQKNGQEKK